jgi:hypothetical protein
VFALGFAAVGAAGLVAVALARTPNGAGERQSPVGARPEPTVPADCPLDVCGPVPTTAYESGRDDLAVAPGAADYYVGPEALGQPAVDEELFESITRCARLSDDGSACVQIEGIAGVPLVSYGPDANVTVDTVGRPAWSYDVQIGTTFAPVTPREYAAQWGATAKPPSDASLRDVTVRGHPGITYSNEQFPAVVWEERLGVLVWVTVPAERADELLTIANGVRRVPGPATIPYRVVLPGGRPYDVDNNNGDSLLVARTNGQNCFGFGWVDGCASGIAGWTFARDDQLVAGVVPPEVAAVRVISRAGVPTVVDPEANDHVAGIRSFVVSVPGPATVEWLDANGAVIDRYELAPAATGVSETAATD